jgi:hypothetical protein
MNDSQANYWKAVAEQERAKNKQLLAQLEQLTKRTSERQTNIVDLVVSAQRDQGNAYQYIEQIAAVLGMSRYIPVEPSQ